jgi:endoglucanase
LNIQKWCFSLLLCGVLAALGACGASTPARSPQNQQDCYKNFGVTLSGAEGVGSDYSRPTQSELQYYSSKGVRLIRLEVRWDKLQPNLNGPLNADEVRWVEGFVSEAGMFGMWVDIDLHERSDYDDLNFGQHGISPQSLADFWEKFAGVLSKDQVPGICGFGIANEPDHDADFLGVWPAQANAVIKAITAVDSKHYLFVGEDNWDSSRRWNPKQASQIHGAQVIFEAHSYWDKGSTGVYQPDIPPSDPEHVAVNNLRPFIDWCYQTNSKCFVGEFGVPPDDGWLQALDAALAYMQSARVFGAYWAGGPGYSDIVSIEPDSSGHDAPQMGVLAKYLA